MNASKKRLGRGLAALIGDDFVDPEAAPAEAREGLRTVAVADLLPSPFNPRQHFDESELAELAQSIREKGLLQPILVRPAEQPGRYEIVAGERRWRAAQMAGVHEVPVIVRELEEREALEVALIENVQRTDLNALEEALGYRRLIDQFGYTQQQLAEIIGKSRSHVANTLRLLNLPDEVQAMIRDGQLSAGHARALVATDDPAALAKKIVKLGLSVREAEQLSQNEGKKEGAGRRKGAAKEPAADVRALAQELEEALGMAVSIKPKGSKGGRLVIEWRTLEQLDDLRVRLLRS